MKRIILITADDFEDLEVFYPYYRLLEEGYKVDVASIKAGEVCGKHGYVINANLDFSRVKPEEYDALVIPGGRAPERIRLDSRALDIVRHFFNKSKPVAVICHGIQILISAGLAKGRKATCWWGVKDDFIAAGGEFIDREVVVDGNLVSSRHPADLPAFMREFIKILKSI